MNPTGPIPGAASPVQNANPMSSNGGGGLNTPVSNAMGIPGNNMNSEPDMNNIPKLKDEFSQEDDSLDFQDLGDDVPSEDNDIEEILDDPSLQENIQQAAEEAEEEMGPKPGDKVEPGKEINENGEVEDSSTKKLTKAVGRGAAAYFTGGQSVGKDSQVLNNRFVDQGVGVVSDTVEKVPGVKAIADELDDAGVTDGVNDALDAVGSLKEGDIAGTVEKAKDLGKDVDKFKKKSRKKMMMGVIAAAGSLLLVIIIFISVIAPVAGGFLDLTEGIGEFFEDVGDFFSDVGDAVADWFDSTTIDFTEMTEDQQAMVVAGVSILGRKYNWGGHPTGPGLEGVPTAGLDCGGYVQWVIWTATGSNPGTLTTDKISDLIGTKFIEVDKSDLQPGDIGLKYKGHKANVQNHTGVYAGNGYWLHAASTKQGIISSQYSGFTVYLRYVG